MIILLLLAIIKTGVNRKRSSVDVKKNVILHDDLEIGNECLADVDTYLVIAPGCVSFRIK